MLLGALAGALVLMLMLLPVHVRVQYDQNGWQASLQLEVQALFLRLRRSIWLTEGVQSALEHAIKRWLAKGEPVKVPLQKTGRRMPRASLIWVTGRPLRYLAGHATCVKLDVRAELGGYDAMESALLAGASWTLVGNLLAVFRRWVRLKPDAPVISIVPHYAGPAWRIHIDCIVRSLVGHAIVAGVWLLRRALGERELVAWARDSWRRKGVDGSGRASDSGSYENGYGESEGHGGRKHGHR